MASIDELGLVAVTTTIEVDPRSDFYGHGPTQEVEMITRLETMPVAVQEAAAVLIGHFGLDEGERILLRFPTVAEDRQRLAQLVAMAVVPASKGASA